MEFYGIALECQRVHIIFCLFDPSYKMFLMGLLLADGIKFMGGCVAIYVVVSMYFIHAHAWCMFTNAQSTERAGRISRQIRR